MNVYLAKILILDNYVNLLIEKIYNTDQYSEDCCYCSRAANLAKKGGH